jgi:hypothetical protein
MAWFGNRDPKMVTPEALLELRRKVAERVSPTEAHRVIKVWRAMWKKLQAFGYCSAKDKDPSLAFSNIAPDPSQDVWEHAEVVQIGKPGLAALMAVIWDSMLSPGDARTLTPGQRARDTHGAMFFLDRAKTGRAAAGTLTSWSEQILEAYIASLGVELLDNAPIFRTAGSGTGPKGGRRDSSPCLLTERLRPSLAPATRSGTSAARPRVSASFGSNREGLVASTSFRHYIQQMG